ncbi:MAG: sensor histidine kinase [Kiritimatiellia bacterium]
MPRAFSTRRFTFAYAGIMAALVALAAYALHYYSLQRQERQLERRRESLQHLLVSSYRELGAERFPAWLARVDFQAWAAPGWNLLWLAADGAVRWTVQPAEPAAVPAALRALAADPRAETHDLPCQTNGRRGLADVHFLDPADPEAGCMLLVAPVPRFFADAPDFWIAAAGFFLALLGIFVVYQRLLLGRIRRIVKAHVAAGTVPPGPDQFLETWAVQHATLASRRMSEERDHFDALFDLLQDGTLVLDAGNRIRRANATANRLLGETDAPLIGRALADLPDREALEGLVDDIRGAAAFRSAEIQLRDGERPCQAAGVPLHEEGSPASGHVLLVLRDISRMRQLERAGEEYATNVSHELKTPLTLILGYTETLLSHADMEPDFRDRSLRTIEHHARRILRIIDDLLRLAWLKNEAEAVGQIPRAPVTVAAVAAEAVASCREWARNAGIAVDVHVPDGLTWSLHAGLMEEALANLLKNAILYALVGPVEIRARVLASGHLELAVVDRGPGLKPEDAQRIFDRFYRADKGRARTAGGSGLGLPIVQQIVHAHRGTARVETAPGEGCTFLLEIPPA